MIKPCQSNEGWIASQLDELELLSNERRYQAIERLGDIGEVSPSLLTKVTTKLTAIKEDPKEDKWIRGAAKLALLGITNRHMPRGNPYHKPLGGSVFD